MKKITAQEMKNIIDLWLKDNNGAPEGKFYCLDNEVWVGCDNTHACCWVEEFKTEEDVIKWLNDEFVYDVNNYPLNEWAKEENVMNERDEIIRRREEIYDEMCRVLTDWETQEAVDDDLYNMLVKIQKRWEDTITVQND